MQNTIDRIKQKNNLEYRWLIIPKKQDIAIDIISANEYDLGYKLGYYIRKSYQGKGVMTEVMKYIIQYLFLLVLKQYFQSTILKTLLRVN